MKNFKKLIKEAHLGNPLNKGYDDEDIVIYDGEEHIIMSRDGDDIYIRPLEDSAILGKKDEIKVPARALAYKSDLEKMYDEYKPKDEVNEENEKWDKISKMKYGKPWMELSIDQKQKILKAMPKNKAAEKEFERRMAMREEFSSTEQKMIKQIQSYKKRDSAMVNLPSKVRDFYFKNKEKIDALNEELKLGVKYELPTGETGYIMTGGSKDPKDWKFTGNKEPYLSVKDKLKPTEKQPGKYDGVDFMDENINDPVLVKTRASQMKRDAMDKKDLENKTKRISAEKAIDLRYELSILDKEREDILMRIEDIAVEMDQTAEPEGGPIADELGERLMAAQRELRAIDSKIIDVKDDLGIFDMNESVNEDMNENTLGDLVKKYGKDLINFVIDIDELTKEEIKDIEYLDDRIQIHLEEPEIRQRYLPEGTCGYTPDGEPRSKPANPDMEEAIDLDIDDAHSGDAALDRAVGKMGYNESLQETLRKKLRKRLS